MTLRGVLRGIGKTLKWTAIVLALLIGLLLAINAVDENPTPELQALLNVPPANADPANGYLAFVGIQAPLNEDMAQYGAQWVDTFNKAATLDDMQKANARFKAEALKLSGDEKALCVPAKALCLPEAKKKADLWRKLAAGNAAQLERQRRLMTFTRFEETYFPPRIDSPIPRYISSSRTLALDLIALDAAEGRLDAALAALETRIAFDRRMLLGAHHLITGMVANAWLRQDYALLAEIIAARPAGLAAQRERLARMTVPLKIAQVRAAAGQMLEGENRIMARSLPQLLDPAVTGQDNGALFNFIARPFFKLHASQNLLARGNTATQARLSTFSPAGADAWIAQGQQRNQADADALYSWRMVYNPLGKYLWTLSLPDYDSYVLRLSDLMGVIRLARLQAEIATENVKTAAIPARLAADPALFDPYTNKPMGWDAAKGQLYFDLRGPAPSGAPKHIVAGI